MPIEPFTLTGKHVRLEPLELHHAEALVAATAGDRALYERTFVPFDIPAAQAYIQATLDGRAAGHTHAFATIRQSDNTVIGSTRFWNIEHWAWPADSPHHNARKVDVCEIGYTWLAPSAIRTPINSEQKLLMLTHAFEVWNVLRVSFHTDERNHRSSNALQRIGAKLEGTLRAHRIASDITPRNSLRFSIIASEWPAVKQALENRLT
jgi:RimJ/RimL family protein N-acetyltransferase